MAQITVTGFDTDSNAVPVTVVTQFERNEGMVRELIAELSRVRGQMREVNVQIMALKGMKNRGENLGWEVQCDEAITALCDGYSRLAEQEARLNHTINTTPTR